MVLARSLVLSLLVLFPQVVWAQPEADILRLYLGATGTQCVVHPPATGAPSTSLGAVCDLYVRKDAPYTVYVKTGASTWAPLFAANGLTTGDLIYASGANAVTSLAAVSSGQVLASAGSGTAPAYTANPSITTMTATGNPGILIDNANANFRLSENDAAVDNKNWVIRAQTEQLAFRAIDDAVTGGTIWLTVDRTGTAVDNVTFSPSAGDIIFAPGGQDILPDVGYTKNLGAITSKYLTLHAAELWVETLVAQNTIATIGGRVLVGPTTVLTVDLAAAGTTITVKHNQMANGDKIYMEANGKYEAMTISSSASGSAGAYTYTVVRNEDKSGANDWTAGDAIFNTGGIGSGFIDLYSLWGLNGPPFSHVYNFNTTGSVYSTNYASASQWPVFGDGANDATNDAVYFGSAATFQAISMNTTTGLVPTTATFVNEYWNGSAWTSYTPTGTLAALGKNTVVIPALAGWATTTVNGVSAFWVRVRLSNNPSPAMTPATAQLPSRVGRTWGPTITGNVRTGTTYSDIAPRWMIGNLNGGYGYGSDTYGAAFGNPAQSWIKIDDTNGVRLGNNTTTTIQLSPSGAATFAVGNVTIDSTNGITLTPPTSYTTQRAFAYNVPTGTLGLFGTDNTGPTRNVKVETIWTGTGNANVSASLQAWNDPLAAGSNHLSFVSAQVTGATSTLLRLYSGNGDVWLEPSTLVYTPDLNIYANNGSTSLKPYIRSDGNYLVIESRSAANGGGIYIGNDNNAPVVIGAGGGTLTVGGATNTVNVVGGGGLNLNANAGTMNIGQVAGGQIYLFNAHFTNAPPRWATALAQTTVGATGGASALPANPAGYIKIADAAGNVFVVPVYNP